MNAVTPNPQGAVEEQAVNGGELFLARLTGVAIIGCLVTSSPAAEPVPLPDGTRLETVDFNRHVAPLLGRLGCNGADCHGAFQGPSGFRLSLFGHDAAADYLAVTRDSTGSTLR